MRLLSDSRLENLKSGRRHDLDEIRCRLTSAPHLWKFLQEGWFQNVGEQINQMQADLRFNHAGHELLRIFTDEGIIDRLDNGLAEMERMAQRTGKAKSFKGTALSLTTAPMDQKHQIDSVIFEILTIRGLIRAMSSPGTEIELYPCVGNTGSNVEARLKIDSRWCYAEVTAMSRRLIYGDAMAEALDHILVNKSANGKQLALVPHDEPAVLLLGLKGDLNRRYAHQVIENFLRLKRTPLSAVLVFGSAFCRNPPVLIVDSNVCCPLTSKEAEFFRDLYANIA